MPGDAEAHAQHARSSRGVSEGSTRRRRPRGRFDWDRRIGSARIAFLSCDEITRQIDLIPSPIGVSREIGSFGRSSAPCATFSAASPASFGPAPPGVRLAADLVLASCREVRTILLIVSIMCTRGMRMVRA